MLKHLITEDRLDGDFYPRRLDGEFIPGDTLMPCGFVWLCAGLWMLFYGERLYFHSVMELDNAQKTYFEEDCDKENGQGIVHLSNCEVTGAVKFTSELPGLQDMQAFEAAFSETPEGVWLNMHVQEQSRRRCPCPWLDIPHGDPVYNMQSNYVTSDNVYVGHHSVSDDMAALIPGHVVRLISKLRSNDDIITYPDHNYNAYNMQVTDNMLYTTLTPSAPEAWDFRIWFEVGDSKKVSVLGTETSGGEIVEWYVKDFGYYLGRISQGSLNAATMFKNIGEDVQGGVWSNRWYWTISTWFATWVLVYPHRVCDCFCSDKKHGRADDMADDCSSFFRAFFLAIPSSLSVIITAYCSLRSPTATIFIGAVFALVLFMVAAIEHLPGFYSKVRPVVPASVGFAVGDRWAGRTRPTSGTEVIIVKDDAFRGTKAVIMSDDGSPIPYVIKFGEVTANSRPTYERYAEGEVEYEVIETDAVVESISEEFYSLHSEEAPAQVAPAQEPMLSRTSSTLLERASSMPVRRSRSMVHAMFLGISIGLLVSVVGVMVITVFQV